MYLTNSVSHQTPDSSNKILRNLVWALDSALQFNTWPFHLKNVHLEISITTLVQQ